MGTLTKPRMKYRLVCLASASIIITFLLPSSSAGQATPQSPADSARTNLLSFNPLGVVFEYFSGEFEHAFSRSASIALAGSYASPYDLSYSSVDIIGRYYPDGALRGFSIGPTVGYTHVADNYSCYNTCSNGSTNAFTLGVELDYSWLVGRSQRFGIETGIGAKRLFYTGRNSLGSDALPTARVSVGYAF